MCGRLQPTGSPMIHAIRFLSFFFLFSYFLSFFLSFFLLFLPFSSIFCFVLDFFVCTLSVFLPIFIDNCKGNRSRLMGKRIKNWFPGLPRSELEIPGHRWLLWRWYCRLTNQRARLVRSGSARLQQSVQAASTPCSGLVLQEHRTWILAMTTIQYCHNPPKYLPNLRYFLFMEIVGNLGNHTINFWLKASLKDKINHYSRTVSSWCRWTSTHVRLESQTRVADKKIDWLIDWLIV